MRLLSLGLAMLLAACTTPKPRPIDGTQNVPGGGPILSESQSEVLSSHDLYIARARATFPEAKRRFLAGLPPGYQLLVRTRGTLKVVDKIESGKITGHWRPLQQYLREDPRQIHEDEIVDWGIVREDRPSRLFAGTLVTSVRSGTDATCRQAQLALESATRTEAFGACGSLGYKRLCGDEGVWGIGSCRWDEQTRSYRVEGFMFFGCC
jgi:hypothetical protein